MDATANSVLGLQDLHIGEPVFVDQLVGGSEARKTRSNDHHFRVLPRSYGNRVNKLEL